MIIRTFVVLLVFNCGLSLSDAQTGPEIVARHTVVMKSPPQRVPSGTVVDGPILGNGDLGVAVAGPAEEQMFYFGKNDFWSQQASPLSVGGLTVRIPQLAGAGYQQEQDIANAEVRGTFTKPGLTVKMRTWLAETENLAVTELVAEGGAASVSASLFPEPVALKDNDKPVNLGREQHGDGRWYFDGLLDEIQIFDRALPQGDIESLAAMGKAPPGLVRRYAFEVEEGTNPVDAPVKVVNEPACPGRPSVYRPNERPVDEPRCNPEGYHLDYQHFGVGKLGRAVKLMHQFFYVDGGTAPPMRQVSVAAWIYIFQAGDQNFILSKGDWNEAYALLLDHGRLRFNVGNQFVRSGAALPVQQWVHVAGTFDGQRLRAYVDGKEVLPRARFLYGGEDKGMLWVTRNADGPLDEQYAWPNPIASTTTVTTKGREVSFATRVIGTGALFAGGALKFELTPGNTVYLVTPVLSDLDNPEHSTAARARAAALTPTELGKLNAAHREWWRGYWSESSVEIGDPVVERSYYVAQYIIASSSRTGKVAPGLYGNWVTTDHPSWNGDYTLNYNHQTPFLALYASNHVKIADSYDPPVLAMMQRAQTYARTMLNVRGVYYPGHIGPWGLERPFDYDPFMGQKSNAAFLVQPMLMRFYSTYDTAYGNMVYPFVREVGNFWEDYLKFENGRYVIYDDCVGEVGPWASKPGGWNVCPNTKNPLNEIGFLRATFKGLIDLSWELGVDADRRDKWQDILDRLSAFPTEERDGKTVFRSAENSTGNVDGWGALSIWPAGQIGFGSDTKLLETARNGMALTRLTHHPLSAPARVRTGYGIDTLLADLARICTQNSFANGYLYWPGGGVETASTVPGAVNEMLLQSHEGVLRFFPVWPKNKDARFGNLRAYGAFLVSASFTRGEAASVRIVSEKGRDCTVENPWRTRKVILFRDGKKAETVQGERLFFKTRQGEVIELKAL